MRHERPLYDPIYRTRRPTITQQEQDRLRSDLVISFNAKVPSEFFTFEKSNRASAFRGEFNREERIERIETGRIPDGYDLDCVAEEFDRREDNRPARLRFDGSDQESPFGKLFVAGTRDKDSRYFSSPGAPLEKKDYLHEYESSTRGIDCTNKTGVHPRPLSADLPLNFRFIVSVQT